jgi:hypothetical protein
MPLSLDDIAGIQNFPDKVKYRFGNVPVVYEFVGVDASFEDYLPSYLCTRPSVGDIVISNNGKRFEIKGIAHFLDGKEAALQISLGRPSGGQTAMSGGGAMGEIGEE